MRGTHKIMTFIRGEKEHNQQSQATKTKTSQFTAPINLFQMKTKYGNDNSHKLVGKEIQKKIDRLYFDESYTILQVSFLANGFLTIAAMYFPAVFFYYLLYVA